MISCGREPDANSNVRLLLAGQGLAANASRDTGFPWTIGWAEEWDGCCSEEVSTFDSEEQQLATVIVRIELALRL